MEEVKIIIQATPSELRHWASLLENENSERIIIRWYYTKLIIEKPSEKLLPETNENRPHLHRIFVGATHCIDCGADVVGGYQGD